MYRGTSSGLTLCDDTQRSLPNGHREPGVRSTAGPLGTKRPLLRLQRVQGQHGEEGAGSAGDACYGAQVEGVLREQRPRVEGGGVRDVRGELGVVRSCVLSSHESVIYLIRSRHHCTQCPS